MSTHRGDIVGADIDVAAQGVSGFEMVGGPRRCGRLYFTVFVECLIIMPRVVTFVVISLSSWCVVARAGSDAERASPSLTISNSLKPLLRLSATVADRLQISGTCDVSGTLDAQAVYRVPKYGKFTLHSLHTLEWSKLVLFPGILDAATKLEVRTVVDLQTRRAASEVKLGLRRKVASSGLSLVHRVELEPKLPGCSFDVGATLTLPEELRLATSSGSLRELARAAHVEVDLDTLELNIDLDALAPK